MLHHGNFSGDSDATDSDLMQYTCAARPASVMLGKGAGAHVPYHRTCLLRLVFVARPSKACHGSNPSVHICFSLITEGVKHETKALCEQVY